MALTAFQFQSTSSQLWQRLPSGHPPQTGTGLGSLVLGHVLPGVEVLLAPGDHVTLSQSADFDNARMLRVKGKAVFHELTPGSRNWAIELSTGGYTEIISDLSVAYNGGYELSLNDLALPVPPLAGAQTIAVKLSFNGGAGNQLVQLPTVIFDEFTFDATASLDVDLINRVPHPGQIGVPTDLGTWKFTVADLTNTGIALASTTVVIEGTTVYTAGAAVGSFGVATSTVGPSNTSVEFIVTVNSLLPLFQLESDQLISVQVISETVSGSTINETYQFNMADVVAPVLRSAVMQDKATLRVQYDDDMVMDSTLFGVLGIENYSVGPVGAVPAVDVIIDTITQVDSRTVDIAFTDTASFAQPYQVTVSSYLQDTAGNTIQALGRTVSFTSFQPDFPELRHFNLYEELPDINRREDVTGDLERFMSSCQDVVDQLLCDIDTFTDIFDPDVCSEAFLDAMLQDLGNPFTFIQLSVEDKRRLVSILIEVYEQKGTAQGVINAVRFLVGVEITLDIFNAAPGWSIGVSALGVGTIISPTAGSSLWYSFSIISPVSLTADQRDKITRIATYMKAAHEHIIELVEPAPPVIPLDGSWLIADETFGVLGVGTILGP